MAQEKEIKVILSIPLEDFINRLLKANFAREKVLFQKDQYFDTKERFLYKSVAALRIRTNGDGVKKFAFKKLFNFSNKKNKWYVEEVEKALPFFMNLEFKEVFAKLKIYDLPDSFNTAESLKDFLTQNGYIGDVTISKERTVFNRGDVEIVVDDIKDLGIVIEIECKSGDPHQLAKEILSENEWTITVEGTSNLWMRKNRGLDDHLEYLRRLQTDPEWNVWETERSWYNNIQRDSL